MTPPEAFFHRLHVPVRCAALIDAPESAVGRALRRSDVWIRSARAVGGLLQVSGDALHLDQGTIVRFRYGPHARTVLLRANRTTGPPWLDSAIAGRRTGLSVRSTIAPTAAGVLVTVEFFVDRVVAILNPLARPGLIRYGEMLLGIVTLVAREPVRVVAGAVVAQGRVLLARRKSIDGNGRWELPGGKVEAGESDEQALERELREELALRCQVLGRIGPVVQIDPGMNLFCYRAEAASGGPIRLVDHDEFRWIRPDELDSLDLLDADRHFVDSLRLALQIDL